jgi:ParB family chromosome partitioning protein
LGEYRAKTKQITTTATTTTTKKGLGKGFKAEALEAVFLHNKTNANAENKSQNQTKSSLTHEVVDIEISKIVVNPLQPRKEFDQNKLIELKDTIIEYGLMQPITVKEIIGGYELVAGERRYRAFKLAGYEKIPAIITSISSDAEQLEKALIENIQREDLNPIDIASSYQQLIEKCNYTQEQLAAKVGKERSTVTNFIRLLKLPASVQDLLTAKKISGGHARALLALENNLDMISVANDIIIKGLSVRATESLIKNIGSGKTVLSKDGKKKIQSNKQLAITTEEQVIIEEHQNKLRTIYGTNVRIFTKNDNKGSIEIEFYSADDFERIIELLEANY